MQKYYILWQSCSRESRLFTNRLQISLKYVGTSMQKKGSLGTKGIWGFAELKNGHGAGDNDWSQQWPPGQSSPMLGRMSAGWLCRILKRDRCPLFPSLPCGVVSLSITNLNMWIPLPCSYLHHSKEEPAFQFRTWCSENDTNVKSDWGSVCLDFTIRPKISDIQSQTQLWYFPENQRH